MNKERPVEETYKQYTQYEHVLNRPDTYVGSLEFQREKLWVYNNKEQQLEFREVSFVPGLFKIFDEIIVNAADNYQRDNKMKFIKVEINKESGEISVKNGGRGIPVEIHKQYNMYVPELIFGNLLTSSNYNDDVKKVTGGRNGYGAKLTNIFSTSFTVETVDSNSKKYYKQTWTDNMLKKGKPEIKDHKKDDYTCITFKPDLKKFKMDSLDEDIVALFTKRVYDLAGVTPSSVEVYWNKEKLDINNFESYMNMYIIAQAKDEDLDDMPTVFERPNERWEIGMSLSESQFQQVSFVNSICTTKGGTHVNYVADKIINAILEEVKKKNKTLDIKPQHVRQHLWLFVNAQIENSAFDSQTKETLTSKKDSFGSSFEFSDKFMKKVIKSGIVERCLRYAKTREEEKALKKINNGNKKVARWLGIDKLDDANMAGTKNSGKCTLILTEGDSAKSLAMAGIEVVGRDTYGCFPLRGKMWNVRDARTVQISNNVEVQNWMKILGIRVGENYTDVNNLRYGSIMIMTDQDTDGSHIKGLIINFIHHFWPSLIKMNGFVREFITPIMKATKGQESISFYTLPEYKEWLTKRNNNTKGWKLKYYKGLGTSTNKEAQEYFSEIQKHKIDFEYIGDKDDESIDLAFNKKKTEERKNWLMGYDPKQPPLDWDIEKLSYQDFINKELMLFSIYDNQRSIPSLVDGFKPSERKILFACFKRNLKEEIKVAQLIGYVSEHSSYHHGETSLAGTIVAMSQNFVGSNNLNLLLPLGQFGTRNQGGKDSASARYIFTNLNKVTRHLFNPNDLPLMNYIIDEGQKIEPHWYLPIIPLILINGHEGIGTGWSTNIPCFNPHDIVNSIKNKITNGKFLELFPWYKGYTGSIEKSSKTNVFNVTGKFYWSDTEKDILYITELPIKKWTKDYRNFLGELMGIEIMTEAEKNDKKNKDKKEKQKKKEDKKEDESKDKKKKEIIVADIKENHASDRILFEVKILPEYVDALRASDEKVIKMFKLQSTISLTNMVLFNHEGKIKKYNSVEEILGEFYEWRLQYYDKRKKHMVSVLTRDLGILDNKTRFILAVIDEEIVLRKVKRIDLIKTLLKWKFDPMSKLDALRIKTKEEEEAELEMLQNKKNNEEEEDEEDGGEDNEGSLNENTKTKWPVPAKEFDYLLTMPLWSLTYEKVEELEKQRQNKKDELDTLQKLPLSTLWTTDLDDFIVALDNYEKQEELDRLTADNIKKKKGISAADKPKRKRNKKKDDDNSTVSSASSSKEKTKKGKKGKSSALLDENNSKGDLSDWLKGSQNKIKKSKKEEVSTTNSSIQDGENDIIKLSLKERLKLKMGPQLSSDVNINKQSTKQQIMDDLNDFAPRDLKIKRIVEDDAE